MIHEGTTAYHARYFARDLTLRKASADADRPSKVRRTEDEFKRLMLDVQDV